MNKPVFKAISTLILFGSVILQTPPIYGAEPGNIAINPFSQVLTIQPGQPNVTANFDLVNNTGTNRVFEVSSVDFGSLAQTGGLLFSGENAANLQKKYGLTKWLSINTPLVEVPAGKIVSIPVTILNRDDLSPGGHYGAVIFTERANAVNGQVSLHSAITSLLFVQKLGGEKYGIKLDETKRSSNWWQSLTLHLTFRNTGNIDIVPRGLIRLLSPTGKEVARGAINEDSARLLPETSRGYTTPLITTGHISTPGRYKLEIKYRYDGQDNFTTYTVGLYYFSFWGVMLPITAILVLALGLWLGRRRFRSKG